MSHSFGQFAGLPRIYSHSLFHVAKAEGVLDIVATDMERLEMLLVDSDDLRSFCNNPIISMRDKKIVISDLIDKAHFCVKTANFLRVLVANSRLSILSSIIDSFHAVCLYYRNEVIAHVKTFGQLSLEQKGQLQDCLEKMVCKRVVLDITVDPALMGGFIVEVDCHQIDVSLRTKLLKIGIMLKEVD
ncbi:MAG: ATP synthase F1 subunit delta [Candidatus Liberibacter ctenarytainae]|uniref:ATP synthase subunit delta n=1 Tax=Candidatus Liberibacter ctenarytainae TaxID=2020335 RepID=A0A937AK31_9HYPH|nr:ATP synthase F1 subunit delta [Candidatus Liberibacter ctenarytainae]